MGDYQASHEYAEQGLKLEREIGSRNYTATLLLSLGLTYQWTSNYADALKKFTEALQVARELNHPTDIATTLHSVADIHYLQGHFETAKTAFLEVLALDHDGGRRDDIAKDLNSLGALEREMGNREEAQRLLEQSRELAREVKHRLFTAVSTANLATLARETGNFATALADFDEALTLVRELKRDSLICDYLVEQVITHALLEQPTRASPMLGEALALAKKLDTLPRKHQVLLGAAYLANSRGEKENAARWTAFLVFAQKLEIMHLALLRRLRTDLERVLPPAALRQAERMGSFLSINAALDQVQATIV